MIAVALKSWREAAPPRVPIHVASQREREPASAERPLETVWKCADRRISVSGTDPHPHLATQRQYAELGGQVGVRAGAGLFKRTLGSLNLASGAAVGMSTETRTGVRNTLRGRRMSFVLGAKYPAFQMIHHLAGWSGGAEPLRLFPSGLDQEPLQPSARHRSAPPAFAQRRRNRR